TFLVFPVLYALSTSLIFPTRRSSDLLPYEFDNMSGELWLSGDTQDTYDKDNKLYNNQVKMPNLSVPVLQPGKNTITITAESGATDRKSTRLNSSHVSISYAVFCLKTK